MPYNFLLREEGGMEGRGRIREGGLIKSFNLQMGGGGGLIRGGGLVRAFTLV